MKINNMTETIIRQVQTAQPFTRAEPPETQGFNQPRPVWNQNQTGPDRSHSRPDCLAAAIRQQSADSSSQPAWLEAKRQQLGRQVRPDTCPDCDAPLLVGLDADLCALTATVDITTASAAQETMHLLAGGTSYDYIRGELHYRDHHRHREYPVLLSHKCEGELQPTLFDGKATT